MVIAKEPLPGRTNIVVSRDASFAPDGVVVARNLEDALTAARDDARRRGVDEIVVIGGTDIFVQTMPLAERMEITNVHASPKGTSVWLLSAHSAGGHHVPRVHAAEAHRSSFRHRRSGCAFG